MIRLTCFWQVIWKRLLKKGTSFEKGTLQQLKILIGRTNVPKEPKKDVHACEDFLGVVVKGHLLAAVKEMEEFRKCDGLEVEEDKYTKMFEAVEVLVKKLVIDLLSFDSGDGDDRGASRHTEDESGMVEDESGMAEDESGVAEDESGMAEDESGMAEDESGVAEDSDAVREDCAGAESDDANVHADSSDGIFLHARHVLSLGLLHHEFVDAIREGDGLRVLRCWRFFLPLFKSSNRKNYAIEALNLMVQYHYTLPPRQAEQLLWSRFVNTVGWAGHNISCDLHMEHLNRNCKTAVGALGANVTKKSLIRTGKCIGTLMKALSNFDSETELKNPTGTHSLARDEQDIAKIVKQLEEVEVFKNTSISRTHRSFPSLPKSVYGKLTKKKLISWMQDTITKKYPTGDII